MLGQLSVNECEPTEVRFLGGVSQAAVLSQGQRQGAASLHSTLHIREVPLPLSSHSLALG